ncbi:MAG: OmpA family protein [Campylobacter sp.]|nr:OmpA family protein [Campylobacter sp.]
MKKLFLTSVAVAALVLSGCSKKTPEVDVSEKILTPAELAAQIQGQTQKVYFGFDKYNVTSDMQSVVASNAALFNQAEASSFDIRVEGNCDEWGTDEYNYALGLKRATSIKDELIKNGVNADRVSVVSYGESNPVCTDKTKDCDAQNRRGEFTVTAK